MHRIAPLRISSLTTGGWLLGDLGASTNITLGESLAVFVFVLSLVVWLSRKLQKLEDDIAALKTDVGQLPCHTPKSCRTGGGED